MLSRCPGFRGHENEHFWKRLVDVLARDPTRPEQNVTAESDERTSPFHHQDAYASDAHLFFPSVEAPTAFPRFRLVVGPSECLEEEFFSHVDNHDDDDLDIDTADEWFDVAMREFVGLGATEASSASVRAHVAYLLRHIDENLFFDHVVDISANVGDFFPLQGLAERIRALASSMDKQSRETTRATRRAALLAGYLRFPVAALKEFADDLPGPVSEENDLTELTAIIESCNLEIPLLEIQPMHQYISEESLSLFIDRTKPRGPAQVDVLSVSLEDANRRQVEIVFSSLPSLNVNKIRIRGATGDRTMDEHGWTWLAYAVYHPWTATSRLAALDIHDLDVSEPTAACLKSVLAAHASLYRLVHFGRDDDSVPTEDSGNRVTGQYVLVEIAAGAKCYKLQTLRGEKLCRVDGQTTLTAVVKFSVRDRTQLPPAVCVVVPNQGHGWIAKESITRLALAPATSAGITSICMGTPRRQSSVLLSSLQPLIANVSSIDMPD